MPTRMDIFDDEPTEAPVVDTDMTLIADGLSTCRLGASDSEPEPDMFTAAADDATDGGRAVRAGV